MSYEILTSINFKKRSITSYSNNVHPRDIGTTQTKFTNDDDFMKWLLGGINSGDFHISANSPYAYLYDIIHQSDLKALRDEKEKLYAMENKDWNYLSKEFYRIDKEMEQKIFETYKTYKNPKGRYIIIFGAEESKPRYCMKFTKYHLFFAFDKDKAKVYKNLGNARVALYSINRNYNLPCSLGIYDLTENKLLEDTFIK